MRKRVIERGAPATGANDPEWLDLSQLARVEVTSEDPAHPVEEALVPGRDAGWRANMLWGVPVRVPSGFNRAAVRNLRVAEDCPRVHARHSRPLTMAQWRAMGVTPVSRSLRETDMATLIEPDGPGQTAYLVTDNYRAILKYNCSNFYALSVALLADGIIGR